MSHRYQDLIVWQKAKGFASEIYRATESFPRTEIYGLTSQLRRAGVSVASNIGEGQGRLTKGEFCNFFGQARGSLLELETQLAIAVDLHFLSDADFKSLKALVGDSEVVERLDRIASSEKTPRLKSRGKIEF